MKMEKHRKEGMRGRTESYLMEKSGWINFISTLILVYVNMGLWLENNYIQCNAHKLQWYKIVASQFTALECENFHSKTSKP